MTVLRQNPLPKAGYPMVLSLGQSSQERGELAEHFVLVLVSQIPYIFVKMNAHITQSSSAIRKTLIRCVHSKEQRHQVKQDPDRQKYLNILNHVFRGKHLHNLC